MVTLKDLQGRETGQTRRYRMEMMIVLGGLMTMMLASLVLQHASYRKVAVTSK